MPNFKGFLLCATLGLGLPTLALAQSETTAPETAPAVAVTADTVLATVGELKVTVGHVIAAVEDLDQEESNLPNEVILKGLTERLIQQAAISQSETDRTQATKLRLENETRSLVAGEIVGSLAEGIDVTDEDVKGAYDIRFGDFTPGTEYNAAHILVATEDEAKTLVDELTAGADFAETAKVKSTGPSGPGGGNLGWFARGQMVQPFQDAVEALAVGDVSAPVQTEFGWHVIKLIETRIPEVPTLEMVAVELQNEMFQLKLRQGMEALVDSAEIVRMDIDSIDPNVIRDGGLIGR